MNTDMRDMFTNTPPRRAERRKGLDKRGKIGLALSIVGWSLWGVGMYIVYFALPQKATYFDQIYNKSPNESWKPDFIYISLILWAAGVALSLLSLYQFRKRYRRRSDKRHIGILTAFALNAVSIVAFAVFALMRWVL